MPFHSNTFSFKLAVTFACLVVTIFSTNAQSQRNDWTEYGFFGKPKRIEVIIMDLQKSGSSDIASNPHRLVITFSPDGIVDSLINYSYDEGLWDDFTPEGLLKPKDQTTPVRWKMRNAELTIVDQDGLKIEKRKLDENGNLTSVITLQSLSDRSYSATENDTAGVLLGYATVFLNKNGNIVRIREVGIEANGTHSVSETVLKRSKFGPAHTIIRTDESDKSKHITKFEVLEKDAFGNPVKTLRQSERGESLLLRTYTYFTD
ncbi:MAG: hypothetical protein JNM00_08655 [Flavobacteriales bacterium]|nr:hypothetical protein [Flavobacteriales bacterium]